MNLIRQIEAGAHELYEDALACLAAYSHMAYCGPWRQETANRAMRDYNVAVARIAELSRLPFERVDFQIKRTASERRDRWLRRVTRC